MILDLLLSIIIIIGLGYFTLSNISYGKLIASASSILQQTILAQSIYKRSLTFY